MRAFFGFFVLVFCAFSTFSLEFATYQIVSARNSLHCSSSSNQHVDSCQTISKAKKKIKSKKNFHENSKKLWGIKT
jgi:hypothetical protein